MSGSQSHELDRCDILERLIKLDRFQVSSTIPCALSSQDKGIIFSCFAYIDLIISDAAITAVSRENIHL